MFIYEKHFWKRLGVPNIYGSNKFRVQRNMVNQMLGGLMPVSCFFTWCLHILICQDQCIKMAGLRCLRLREGKCPADPLFFEFLFYNSVFFYTLTFAQD